MQKAEGLTLSELGAEMLLRLRRKAAKTYHRVVDEVNKSYITDQQLRRAIKGSTVAQIANHIREGKAPHLTEGLADLQSTAAIIKQNFPESATETLGQAEAILNHQLIIFGRTLDFGQQIDWHTDMETGVRWPLLHYTKMPIAQGKSSDVRAVWELNRLHHFVTLGRAYGLSKDERFATEFIRQFTSWYEANPPRYGVNWAVAMEAGIRAINLIAALDLFRASPMLTDLVIELALKMLLAHGRYIRANLEFSHRVSSNHYLSDLIGLFVTGAAIPYFHESSSWVKFATEELLKEMGKQILTDGADFEASINYHRLVLEIFLMFSTLSRSSGVELPVGFYRRFEAMFDFVRAYVKPDGEAPLIGDSDDGRLLKFKERPSTDHGYLLSIAAVLFDTAKFKQTNQFDEEAVWWFGKEGLKLFGRLLLNNQMPSSQAFKEAQIFIQRKDSLYLIADCGDHGAKGRGSHAHSDALSFELSAYGPTFLRDPGTYVYTASKPWRHLFRSTAYHNTVRIDRKEISEINQDQPFALGANVLPKLNGWQSDEERDVLDAEHYGYRRLAEPVTHRRIITFNKSDGYWLLEDLFTGIGNHLFEFFFNFDAGLKVKREDDHRIIIKGETSALAIVPVFNITNHISLQNNINQPIVDSPFTHWDYGIKKSCRWVSPSYRTRLRSSGIIYRLRKTVPFMSTFALIPFRLGDEARVLEISSQFAVGNESR
jgi:hypothetical protein